MGVNVGEGSGVGVSGMINLVAARQARVESKSASIQKTFRLRSTQDFM